MQKQAEKTDFHCAVTRLIEEMISSAGTVQRLHSKICSTVPDCTISVASIYTWREGRGISIDKLGQLLSAVPAVLDAEDGIEYLGELVRLERTKGAPIDRKGQDIARYLTGEKSVNSDTTPLNAAA